MAITLQFVLLISIFGGSLAAECCNGYYNSLGNWVDPQWCENYCCGSSSLELTCCSNSVLEASIYDISDFCVIWWKHHIWAPILIVVVNLLFIACCCFCCYKCCCATRNTTVVYQPGMMPQGGGGITIQQVSSQQQQSSMGSYGYDQSAKY